MSINYTFKQKGTEETFGHEAVVKNRDYGSMKELKKAVKASFKAFRCPNCGYHGVDGSGVVVEIGKVRFFREKEKKGFFGKKYVSEHFRDVYRIYNIYLSSSFLTFFSGHLKCDTCKWKQHGGSNTTWLSINDIFGGD
ncbi:MAG: hypothetical protein V3U75_08730 [Methylococcaceae bacterium]